jgi:hypothetical protein
MSPSEPPAAHPTYATALHSQLVTHKLQCIDDVVNILRHCVYQNNDHILAQTG